MVNKIRATFWALVFFTLLTILTSVDLIVKILAAFCWLFLNGKPAQWGFNVWHSADNYYSAVLGGDSEETISSRLGKAKLDGSGWSYMADRVDLVAEQFTGEMNHCINSVEWNEGATQVTGR